MEDKKTRRRSACAGWRRQLISRWGSVRRRKKKKTKQNQKKIFSRRVERRYIYRPADWAPMARRHRCWIPKWLSSFSALSSFLIWWWINHRLCIHLFSYTIEPKTLNLLLFVGGNVITQILNLSYRYSYTVSYGYKVGRYLLCVCVAVHTQSAQSRENIGTKQQLQWPAFFSFGIWPHRRKNKVPFGVIRYTLCTYLSLFFSS